MKKAVVLLSGGLDSTTCLAFAQAQGFSCYALSFAYGQRHSVELQAAKRIASHFAVTEHFITQIDTGLFRNNALTNTQIEVPAYNSDTQIPVTYVPARNTIFLAMALGLAESVGARDIFIGVSSIDYSHYPDCRPEFIDAFTQMANLATKAGVEGDLFTVHAPLQHLSKIQTIELGIKLGVDYGMTISCYQADEEGRACRVCDSCSFRKQGFFGAGISDPTRYVSS